jgi:exodeoxyribonuclease V alpha subunit
MTAVELELHESTVVADRVGETPCIFLAGLYRAERTIAERLTRLANGALPWPWIDPDKALPWVEKRISLALAESQFAAIRLALMAKVLVMTGGPGVGKTTIVKVILRILAAKGAKLLLCAPTGRAAKRMTEATGFEAKTIHRLLEVDPRTGGFKRGEDNPQAWRGQSARLRPAGNRRDLDGRCHAHAGALAGSAREGCPLERWGYRPASIGWTRPGAG